MKKGFVITTLWVFTLLQAYGWGQKGHDVTAAIAERHLSDKAKVMVDSLFDGKSMVYWANWLDNASHTPEYAYSKTWHYKNIDEGVAYEDMPLNENGDVVRAIAMQMDMITNPEVCKDEKTLALKILVHLVGDLHQPMHMGHLSDLGGNTVKVKFFNRDTNLHSVWDESLPEAAHKWSYSEWAEQLDRNARITENISLDDWGKETLALATEIYRQMPAGTKISYNEIASAAPVIEQQLLAGGLRLALILNTIAENYQP